MIWLLGGYMWLFVHRPFEVWPALGSLQIERAYMIVVLLGWAFSPEKGLTSNRIHLALGFFTFALLFAWMVSPFASRPGIPELIENYLKVMVFYTLVVTTVRDERNLRLLILMFIVVNGMYLGHSLLEFLNGRYQYRMGIRRMIGVDQTYSDPNAFAATLLYTLPLALPFWYEQPRRVPRYLQLCYYGSVLVAIMLTGSRMGFIGLCVLGLIILWVTSKNKAKTIVMALAGGMVATIALVTVLPDELQNRYLTILDSSRGPANAKESADGRMAGITEGFAAWSRSPLFGHGPGSFMHATGRDLQAHNLYGQLASEMGILGAIGLFGLVVCVFLNCRQVRRLADETGAPPNDFLRQLSRSLGINILLLLLMGFAGHNLYRYNWQWFAAFSGITTYCMVARQQGLVMGGTYPESSLDHQQQQYAQPAWHA